MDTKFSSVIHTLILISESEELMNSEQIAIGAGANASYIRKLTARMKKSDLIESHHGIGGFKLSKDAKEITLLAVYQSVMAVEQIHIFDIPQNTNDSCVVGKNIKPV